MSIEDRIAIEELCNRYAFLLDNHKHHLVAESIFAEDAVIDYGVGLIHGRDAINTFFTGFTGAIAATAHCYSNFIIEVTGDTARSQAQVQAWHWMAKPDRDILAAADITAIGGSQDQLRRTEKGWRISSRLALQYGVAVGVAPPAMRPILEGMASRRATWPC